MAVKYFRLTAFVLLAVCLVSASAAEEKKEHGSKKKDQTKVHGPGMLTRIWTRMHPPGTPEEIAVKNSAVEREVGRQRVLLSMTMEPQPLLLSETRQLKVTLHVANRQKKMVQLEFPTTQRIEVLVKDKVGKQVEQWSEDRTFANDPGMVSINPGEHLEYPVMVSTRDMVAGGTYVVEAFFPNYDSLRLQREITAGK